jgi:hypothetical protein
MTMTHVTGAHFVPRLWPGATVVCLATGPSLTAADVDAYRLAGFADVLYSSDLPWWRHHRGCPAFGGLKFAIEQAPRKGAREFSVWPDITVLRNTGDIGLETARDALRTGRNSGHAAINLAVHFGAKRIVLLGYDCTGGGRHFFGLHPVKIRSVLPVETVKRCFQALVEPLRQAGVEIVNCSARTELRAFPRRPFAEEAAAW